MMQLQNTRKDNFPVRNLSISKNIEPEKTPVVRGSFLIRPGSNA